MYFFIDSPTRVGHFWKAMKIEQVAVQLYTLRDFCKTPEDIAKSFEKVAAMGYKAVQASALGPIEPDALLKIAADNGLTICATHEASDLIRTEPEKVVEKLAALNCKYTAYPYPSGVDFGSEESVKSLIDDLGKATEVLKAAGQVLTYHNHHVEFRKMGGKTIMDIIYDSIPIDGEIDTYWVQYGGADPVAWCKKLKGRLPLLHLKDFKINEKNEIDMAEVGNGNLDFAGIIKEGEASGCEWFIVEQDRTPGDPFDSLKMSFDYISANLVS